MNVFTIRNNFIQHFGQKEMEELLIIQRKWKVSFKVFFNDGFASINIHGAFTDVRAAALEVEALCCKVQYDFANEEERFMGLKTQISSPRKPLEENTADYMEIKKHFSRFQIVRVEKIENGALRDLFNLKKKQMQVFTSQQMYQCLPSYFCDLLSRVGFQREFAPPDEQKLGKGIYFSGSADGADKLWRGLANEEYLYFIKAQVLTGKSTAGSPGLIVPPERNSGEPFSLFDSVEGGVETHVIFNGWQALPEYLITCKNQTNVV
ncbi:hypothetical protein UPYG_G00112120 [Umbra pygmaea]|uniref:PARP catalytic domain-containing protein n=1 Tax=Umbra pygmaea TaxID=75934 RepID=A0ABD0X419_UMBPY